MHLAVDNVRKRPSMYIGSTDAHGVLHLVQEVLSNAFDQYLMSACSEIEVIVDADHTVTVRDNGPGLRVDGGGKLPPIDRLLTELSDKPTIDGHRPHVHLAGGRGNGLAVVTALSERFELIAVRDGVESRTCYERGRVAEPLRSAPASGPSGTTIRFRPDREIFTWQRAPRDWLTYHLENLSFLSPRLTLRWSIAGDQLASSAGLAGLVAIRASCALDQVAHTRRTFALDSGPLDVEVALTWRDRPGDKFIDSFANFMSTQDGTHIAGLLDAVRKSPDAPSGQLIAAVAVVLADVHFGSPTGKRLDTLGVRKPVAEATRAAIEAWATTHRQPSGRPIKAKPRVKAQARAKARPRAKPKAKR